MIFRRPPISHGGNLVVDFMGSVMGVFGMGSEDGMREVEDSS